MRKKISMGALALLPILGGCTHLEVSKVENGVAPPGGGYAYMLDFTQYQVVLTRTLTKCVPGEMPVVTVEAKVTATLAPDGDQLYVIDPASMISAFKTSDVAIAYKDGRLVSFNASTVDKTGEVLTSVITTAGKIAMMAAVPIPMVGGTHFCTDAAESKLKAIDDNKKPIKEATANVDEAQARLTTLTAQYAAKPTEKLRVAIKSLTGQIKVAQDTLDKRTNVVTEAQAWLTDAVTITWPDTSLQFHRGPGNPLGPAVLAKWFDIGAMRTAIGTRPDFKPKLDGNNNLVVSGIDGTAERLGISTEDYQKAYPGLKEGSSFENCPDGSACGITKTKLETALVARQIDRIARATVSMHIVRRGSYGGEQRTQGSTDRRAGLRYRVPAAGSFYVCTFADPCQTGTGTPLSRTDGAVAQLGTVFNIPFSSPAFASGSVSVTFDDQGRLLTAGLKRDTSTALGMANVAANAADQASSVLTASAKAPITDANNTTKLAQAIKARDDAQAALVKTPQQLAADQLALLKTQQELAALGPDAARDLAKQLEIANLNLQISEAQKKLAADPNAGDAAVAAQYDAQTLVLNARRAKAQADLAAQQAEQALAAARPQP